MAKEKCKFPHGLTIKPDGENELDPCTYKDVEIFTNVNVIVSKCTKCGHIDISWKPTEETEHIELEGKTDEC